MSWYLAVLKNYVGFSGRARRKEYWMFTLFNMLALLVLAVVDVVVGASMVLLGAYVVAVLLPTLAVLVRRLHDTGRSAWWLLIAFVPGVGGLVLFVFAVLEGESGENKYGADPKAVPVAA